MEAQEKAIEGGQNVPSGFEGRGRGESKGEIWTRVESLRCVSDQELHRAGDGGEQRDGWMDGWGAVAAEAEPNEGGGEGEVE